MIISEYSNTGSFLEVCVHCLRKFHETHNDLPLLPKKIEKLVSSFNDKKKYVVHVRNLKQPIKNKLVLQNLHRIIELSQKACFKQYIDMNSQLQ